MSTPNGQAAIIAFLTRQPREEEIHLCPATREHVPGGDEIADHEVSEHDEAEQTLQELGRRVEQTEDIAPTRPHPSAPSEGGALAALAPGAGMVDRIRDALSGCGR
ncbi:hypothetical protein [Pseudonocardia asaccharolytica]|uniref:Uncharacterized protein n=1 Tax=Pseudonocardia asaccharolytica DSM 44247 = NBRC 16224 TaxID=1123024 RepID=A0A511D3D0_9PSEU|nr:hypothetical protein [Pseudonocardia asaccharolytica]GEL19023.1 hypothetical protein PA7_28600 [Pseudonocardia asaccharolytica DSM 44247 = NBRC 16224]